MLSAFKRWVVEARLAWLTLLVLLFAFFVSFRPGAGEFHIRFIGLVLQLLGVGTVVVGINMTRKSFGKPGMVKLFFEWASRFSRWRRHTVVAIATGQLEAVGLNARGYAWTKVDSGAAMGTQVDALTKNLESLNERLISFQKEFDSALRTNSEALRQERQFRTVGDDELQMRLETTQTGGLHISLMGAIWIAVGLILSTLAPELAEKEITQSANLRLGSLGWLPNLQRAQGAVGEGGKENMTIAITILSGLALLVVGQIIIRSFIDPVYELRKLRGEIADALIFYANLYMNPDHEHKTPEIDTAANALRSLASRLETRRYAIAFYRLFALLRAVPPPASIDRARSNLIGLSNSIYIGKIEHNEKRRREIIETLNLKIS